MDIASVQEETSTHSASGQVKASRERASELLSESAHLISVSKKLRAEAALIRENARTFRASC
ncbi:hypothetical protein [Rhodobium gokarnense]|uniref:Methyl-accepting chemotaxis protein n=1 Tax=Rhodobium gokarnense TaxID=364296 RepID=A0ABT3HGU6_9HYPH|nr:hypothetical protein [Rhodobium gokarnense]MCW2309621.1 hypothetical protein [Rhodobium gokarnense]